MYTKFLTLKTTRILSAEQIKMWLVEAKELSTIYVGVIILLLLFADLFIAIPTMTVITLSGYFLGFRYGASASIAGLILAGVSGYWLSHILFKNIPEFTNMIEFTFTENVINVKYKWPLCYGVSYFCVNVHNVFKL